MDLAQAAERVHAEFAGWSMDHRIELVQGACGFSQASLDGAYDALCLAQDRANRLAPDLIELGRELRAQHMRLSAADPCQAARRTHVRPRATARESRSRRVASAASGSSGSPDRPRQSDDDDPALAQDPVEDADRIDRGAS